MFHRITTLTLVAVFAALAVPRSADAQIPDRLKRAAERAATRELERKVETVVGEAVACAVGNRECVEEAQENGEKVVIVDDDGEVITDENGNPIADPEQAEAALAEPGEGRWANYDYLRGERPIFHTRWNVEDTDNPPALEPNPRVRVGRIPSNIEFVEGNMQVVQLDGLNTLEFASRSIFQIPLSEPLPEDFSLEFTIQNAGANQYSRFFFGPFEELNVGRPAYEHHYLDVFRRGGIYRGGDRVSGQEGMSALYQQLTPVKFQVDDGYAILYVGNERVAQVPNFSHPVGSNVIEVHMQVGRDRTAYIRDIRVDYGVEDPVAVFEAEGEYTTRSIYFAFDSDQLRPESTPELERIRMLIDSYGQPVVIEGHTDSVGSDDYNLELSERRAEAVKRYLVEKGIDGDMIETVGKGETEPVADNDTDDGRALNRRVKITTAG